MLEVTGQDHIQDQQSLLNYTAVKWHKIELSKEFKNREHLNRLNSLSDTNIIAILNK